MGWPFRKKNGAEVNATSGEIKAKGELKKPEAERPKTLAEVYKNAEKKRKEPSKLWGSITRGLGRAKEFVATVATMDVGDVGSVVKERVKSDIENTAKGAVTDTKSAFDATRGAVTGAAESLGNRAVADINKTRGEFSKDFNNLGKKLIADVSTTVDNVSGEKAKVEGAVTDVFNIVKGRVDTTVQASVDGFNTISSNIEGVADNADKRARKDIVNTAKGAVEDLRYVGEKVSDTATNTAMSVENFYNKIRIERAQKKAARTKKRHLEAMAALQQAMEAA